MQPPPAIEATFHREPGPHWKAGGGQDPVFLFGGRQDWSHPDDVLALLAEAGIEAPPSAYLDQVHSAQVVEAVPGANGTGDGLWTRNSSIALTVRTADCLPVLFASATVAMAVHAGWRGLAAGILTHALVEQPAAPADLTAWIGPAIGACCYEVDAPVADRVVAASEEGAVDRVLGNKYWLDLRHAAEWQLRRCGVEQIGHVPVCTRCRQDLLWSHRGGAGGRGRNLSAVWLG